MVTQPTTAHHATGEITLCGHNIKYNNIAVAAKDVVEEAELGEKQEEVAGEEEEEVVMVVCPSVYSLLLEQATRMFCISLLG